MSEFRFNETGMRQLQSSRSGTVGRYLGQMGASMESDAKDIATSEGLVRSGRCRASIFWRFKSGSTLGIDVGSGLRSKVDADVSYARFLERGAPAHRILPRNKKALWWTHGADRGWLVPERPLGGVNHPGNRAYNVIERAIRFRMAIGRPRSGGRIL